MRHLKKQHFIYNNTLINDTITCTVQIFISDIQTALMALAFFKETLTIEEKNKIYKKIAKHTNFDGQCYIWHGEFSQDGYGILRFIFRGKRIKTKVHRLVYFVNGSATLSPTMHVSHLCFKKACTTLEHLSYEPQSVNNSRLQCKNDGICCGHRGFSPCRI